MPNADPRLTLPQAFAAEITPNQLSDYLASQGYEIIINDPRGFAVFDRPTGPPVASGAAIVPSEHAIEIPTNPAHRDYPRRVCEALGDLGEPWPGLLHKINPGAFPVARLLAFVGLPCGELGGDNPSDGRDLHDAARLPEVPMNVEGGRAGEEGKPIVPYDLDFYDDEEWALSVGKPWHAWHCKHDYFQHAKPVQTGDCAGAEAGPPRPSAPDTTPNPQDLTS